MLRAALTALSLTAALAMPGAAQAADSVPACADRVARLPARPSPTGLPAPVPGGGTVAPVLLGCPAGGQVVAGAPLTVTFSVYAADFGASSVPATGDLVLYDVDPHGAVGPAPIGTAPLTPSPDDVRLAQATFTVPAGLAALHDVVATYGGDGQFAPAPPMYAHAEVVAAHGTAQRVQRLYLDVLRRLPDDDGAAYWRTVVRHGGATDADYTFALSAEHRAREVDDAFRAVLGREADPAGEAYYTGLLLQGLSLPDLELTLFLSPEVQDDPAAPVRSTTDFVTQMYLRLLDRLPDPGGLAYYLDRIDRLGVSPQQAAREVTRSDEHLTLDLDGLYEDLLDRPVDAVGAAYWSSAIRNGYGLELIAFSVLLSPEYARHPGR